MFYELKPRKFIFLTETGGIYKDGELISETTIDKLQSLVIEGKVKDGMGFKVNEISEILGNHDCIIRNLLYELFTHKGAGTCITK